MKEIYAIIRVNKVYSTKKALEEIGFPSITVFNYRVFGRGKQKGIVDEVSFSVSPEVSQMAKHGGMKYIPKRLLYLVVDDEDITRIVDTIIQANQTGHYGDGRIFVCPVEEALRIRTGEKGAQALA
ncbi:P-II family nitrogen regulator [Desulfoglaeba alkanexedens]|jgi:nitrogen regulatory protein PII 2|uniref:P-II family nitrogen regulator n=1 Tax=Desulfoglaeba alkanexedens ALDC TaxID=980445 RepID=A0A4P8L4H1_9BACT|nr:P-II family nitrogen regulator [Desulfoglaeba alkanexedens]QCQ22876.1 P-II family nitrogen regulator [Desulfoglaeba alkanexedens ALDC]